MREELGLIRLYLFDHSVCISSFIPVSDYPSPVALFSERGQGFLVDLFRRHALESWRHDEGGHPRPKRPKVRASSFHRSGAESAATATTFDVQRMSLSIDGVPKSLPRAVLMFLLLVAESRGRPLPLDTDVDGQPARRRRTDLGQKLGPDMARAIIETIPGLGYRFQPHVKVVGLGEAGLRFSSDMDRFEARD